MKKSKSNQRRSLFGRRARLQSLLVLGLLAHSTAAQLPTCSLPTSSLPTCSLPTSSLPTCSLPTCSGSHDTRACSANDSSLQHWVVRLGLHRRGKPAEKLVNLVPPALSPIPAQTRQLQPLPEVPFAVRNTIQPSGHEFTLHDRLAVQPAVIRDAHHNQAGVQDASGRPEPESSPSDLNDSLLDLMLPEDASAATATERRAGRDSNQSSELESPVRVLAVAPPMAFSNEEASPLQVEIHDGFSPRRTNKNELFHLSDGEDQAESGGETETSAVPPEANVTEVASEIAPSTLLPPPSFSQTSTSSSGDRSAAPPALTPPSSAESLEALPSASQDAIETLTNGRGPKIISSSSNRSLSLRIASTSTKPLSMEESGLTNSTEEPKEAAAIPTAELRTLNDETPVMDAEPVVRSARRTSLPTAVQATAVTPIIGHLEQLAGRPGAWPQSHEMNQAIKRAFPGSRVEVKSDDEGLVVVGVAASEKDAVKILAMVRKAALCPVSDRVITKR